MIFAHTMLANPSKIFQSFAWNRSPHSCKIRIILYLNFPDILNETPFLTDRLLRRLSAASLLLLPHSRPQTAFFEGFPLLPPASSAQQAADRLLRRLSAASSCFFRTAGRRPPSSKAFRCFLLLRPHSRPQTAFSEGFPLLSPCFFRTAGRRSPSSKAFRCFRSSSAAEGAFRPLSNCKSSLSHTSVDILLFHFSCCAELVLHVEAEEDDVSVLYDVVLFPPGLPGLFLWLPPVKPAFQQIFIVYHLGPDKASLKIRVNLSCCLGRFRSLFNCPGSGLCFACRQEAHQAQQIIAGGNQFFQSRLLQSQILQGTWLSRPHPARKSLPQSGRRSQTRRCRSLWHIPALPAHSGFRRRHPPDHPPPRLPRISPACRSEDCRTPAIPVLPHPLSQR